MTKVEHYTQEAINIANDNSHGYSMANRNGNPDYDCSSLICHVVQNAGIPVMDKGASWTGNMMDAFLACGFQNIAYKIGLGSGYGLQRGDVLLNIQNHTALYIGEGKVVNAGGPNGHPEPGDQTGAEIRIQSYWNYPWDAVLRYMGTDEYTGEVNEIVEEPEYTGAVPRPDLPWAAETNNFDYPNVLKRGDAGTVVQEMQAKLNALGYYCGKTDGYFGENTFNMVVKFQEDKKLLVDGEAGPETLGALLNCYIALTGNVTAFGYEPAVKPANNQEDNAPANVSGFTLNEVVEFIGGNSYLFPNGTIAKTATAGQAKITSFNQNAKHQIHLVAVRGSTSKVYGWVDAETIKKV